MKIFYQRNNVAFTSMPVHYVNLRNAESGGNIKAIFSKLNPLDETDKRAVEIIKETWKEEFKLPHYFHRSFIEKPSEEYYAIELIDENKSLSEKIIGLLKLSLGTKENPNGLNLSFLITKPELAKKTDSRKIKGIGEILFGETFNRAKEISAPSIDFTCFDNGFYCKTLQDAFINLNDTFKDNPKSFLIKENYFNKYLDYIKNKYGFNFTEAAKKDEQFRLSA